MIDFGYFYLMDNNYFGFCTGDDFVVDSKIGEVSGNWWKRGVLLVFVGWGYLIFGSDFEKVDFLIPNLPAGEMEFVIDIFDFYLFQIYYYYS